MHDGTVPGHAGAGDGLVLEVELEGGEPPLAAALKGSQQIGFTIISLTFSLIAVLILVAAAQR